MPSALIPLASFRVLLASALGMKRMIHSTDDASSNGAILGFPQEFLDRQAKAYTYADYICEYKSSLGRPSFVVLGMRCCRVLWIWLLKIRIGKNVGRHWCTSYSASSATEVEDSSLVLGCLGGGKAAECRWIAILQWLDHRLNAIHK